MIDKPFPILILDLTLYDDEGKVEDDGLDMFLDMNKFTSDELQEMGITSTVTSVGASVGTLVTSVTDSDKLTNTNDLSLDEMMAMQLQYGDDNY